MMSSVETRLDGSTLIVRIPMRFQRRVGRDDAFAPDGSAIVSAAKPQPTEWRRRKQPSLTAPDRPSDHMALRTKPVAWWPGSVIRQKVGTRPC